MATVNYDAYKVTRETFRALRDDVIVEEMAFKERKLFQFTSTLCSTFWVHFFICS